MARDELNAVTVLVVDDHELTRNLVSEILHSIGVTKVLEANSGEEALSRLLDEPVDLVICDWNMSSMSGLELLKRLRREARFDRVPLLMLTAEAYPENINEAFEMGVTDYVIKPFSSGVLAKKIRAILDKCLVRPGLFLK